MRKGWKRGHRLVVLPDYQGIGIGMKFHDECAKIIQKEGFEVNSTTTTPALIHALKRSDLWSLVRFGRVKNTLAKNMKKYYGKKESEGIGSSSNRITYSFNLKKMIQNQLK